MAGAWLEWVPGGGSVEGAQLEQSVILQVEPVRCISWLNKCMEGGAMIEQKGILPGL